MAFHRESIRKSLIFGFRRILYIGNNEKKVQMCIDNVDKICDWIIENQRQPNTDDINRLIGWEE